jgi:molybdopterin-biosynthesis enzyme MoeA-like protein
MKEVTLKIPDQKFDFFVSLMKELGFEISEKMEIPDEHKHIVRERIKSENPDEMISWENARKQFEFNE